jgi:hypothetical protein
MLKQLFSFLMILSFLPVATFTSPQLAKSKTDKEAKRIEKTKKQVDQLGVGEKSRVVVTLPNGTKSEGYISEKNPDSFTITNWNTGAKTAFAFAEIKKVGHYHNKMPTAAVVAIAVGATIGALIIIAAIAIRD